MTRQHLQMEPTTGERLLRFVGDRVRFTLRRTDGGPLPPDGQAFLRTNLGRAGALRAEIIHARGGQRPMSGASWRDIPMRREGRLWVVELTLTEIGFFKAKAYGVDARGFQVWPDGLDVGISVHPSSYRTANTIYCAFPRMFGEHKGAAATLDARLEARLRKLDERGYTVIPPSGKLRDLVKVLPHIIDTLGCRILHLLPVNPTPTTHARFGRFGSPYAGLDLTAIDPALIEFDRRTTGVDQFGELAHAVHAKGARLFLDLVINHTGWSSTLYEAHPEWYLKNADGSFTSPGAWGVTWEDLVDLDAAHRDLWDYLANAFLTWCRRGVDGFRCDAGYKIPMPEWQYIISRVREEFPETLFLLEGLGGAWCDTENLLTEGGMQWAYSELFQEFSGLQVAGYLDHALKQSRRVGLLVHYSETHDNDRLAKKGRAWSLLRNRLSALASVSGGFGFTCGVEWLAKEKVKVHGCAGLAWAREENIVPELARLNRLLAGHPCFFDGARLTRLSPNDSPVFALRRDSAEGKDSLLVLVNTDAEKLQSLSLQTAALPWLGGCAARSDGASDAPVDLLGQELPAAQPGIDGTIRFTLEAGACYCLSPSARPRGLSGEGYRRAHAQAAWMLAALREQFDPEEIGPYDLGALAALVDGDARACLGALPYLDRELARRDPVAALKAALAMQKFPAVITWEPIDRRRITAVPPGHWLLIKDAVPFRATLTPEGHGRSHQVLSIPVRGGHVACFCPGHEGAAAGLVVERYDPSETRVTATIRFLPPGPETPASELRPPNSKLVLLTNGLGGMARLCVDLGRITSKYDCLLGANLHASLPVDRHIFAKRFRVWANANGFISPLNADNLAGFDAGPPAVWRFAAMAGDGRTMGIELSAAMLEGRNTTVLQFRQAPSPGASSQLRLTVRVDLEDRNFHWETKRSGGSEHHFTAHVKALTDRPGFVFAPAADRQLRVFSSSGFFHAEPEWSENIPHPVEASRGQIASGDAWSPGWFDLPLAPGKTVTLVVCADAKDPERTDVETPADTGHRTQDSSQRSAVSGQSSRISGQNSPSVDSSFDDDSFEQQLVRAIRAFVVRRGEGKTVIAGYPWFLDWGRDTLICARGLLAAGMLEEVKQLLVTFGRFEESGTLPNTLQGENASNRDTSDAPLWYALACEELATLEGGGLPPPSPEAKASRAEPRRSVGRHSTTARQSADKLAHSTYAISVDDRGRTLSDVLRSVAVNYMRGTPNGIRMDAASGLIWSPSHFTWMDTNYPPCTPREGYPIEVQALWIRLLRQLARIGTQAADEPWTALAERAEVSLQELFWLKDRGYYADGLLARANEPARSATPDTALRSNCLFAVSLGVIPGAPARRCVEVAQRYLLVPGALRSLAPLPVSPPLPIHAPDGRLLNSPTAPYCGRYEGDEDTRRKPAYHNGTAWVWLLPTFCEALARTWDFAPEVIAAARAYLGSVDRLLDDGCLGQLPEILDGDAPHLPRGCDAQAWSITETLRVWRLFNAI